MKKRIPYILIPRIFKSLYDEDNEVDFKAIY